MRVTFEVVWMPRTWIGAFRRLEAWTSRSYGPGLDQEFRATLVMVRLMLSFTVRTYR